MCKVAARQNQHEHDPQDNTTSFLIKYQCEFWGHTILTDHSACTYGSLTLKLFAIARRTALCSSNAADVVEAYI